MDKFACEFLADLRRDPLVEQAADKIYIDTGYDPRDYLKAAKVLRCTPRFWAWLGTVKDLDTMDTSGDEYLQKPPAADWMAPRGIDGWSIQLSMLEDWTHVWHLVTPDARVGTKFLRRFPADIARKLADYDALIFLFVRSHEHDGMTIQRYHCYDCAHECYDLMMDATLTLAGMQRPMWGLNRQDPALEYFNKFEESLPQKTKLFYETRPQADKIDLWRH